MLFITVTLSFTAICVWLVVRIVNRRERWAKWTLAIYIGLPLLYIVGFGPACWISSRANMGASFVTAVYGPVVKKVPVPSVLAVVIDGYSRLGASSGWRWTCVIGSENWKWFEVGV